MCYQTFLLSFNKNYVVIKNVENAQQGAIISDFFFSGEGRISKFIPLKAVDIRYTLMDHYFVDIR